jgi:hypothetical protein
MHETKGTKKLSPTRKILINEEYTPNVIACRRIMSRGEKELAHL